MELTENELKAKERLCCPLDNLENLGELKNRIRELNPVYGLWKVGKGSHTKYGNNPVNYLIREGYRVFLDLKFLDIPNTVKEASYAAASIGSYMFNLHASGGIKMMEAAVAGVEDAVEKNEAVKPLIIGVTVLTSIDQEILNDELGISGSINDTVLRRAELCVKASLDGVVCSAKELAYLKPRMPENFIYVTPGIKGPNTEAGSDQKRVLTPGRAVELGSSYLVCGRAITGFETRDERLKAGKEVLEDMARYV